MNRLLLVLIFLRGVGLAAGEMPKPADLVVKGHTLFTFHASVGSITPEERVKMISQRIEQIADDRLFDLNSMTVTHDKEIGWEIFAGDKLLMVITLHDEKVVNLPGKLIAESIRFRMQEILTEDRRAKSPRELMFQAMYAAGYAIGLALLLFAISRVFRHLNGVVSRTQDRLARRLRIKNFEILSAQRVGQVLFGILGILRIAINLSLLYFFVPLVLSLFPWTARLSPILLGYIVDPLKAMVSATMAFVPNLFFIILIIFFTRYILKLVAVFFAEIERGSLTLAGFYREWAEPTYKLVRIVVLTLAVIVAFPYIPGSSSPAFQGVSVFIGLLLSFGSTSAVSNVMAGIVITYMRSYSIGDRVKIADTMGDVVEKSLLITRIRTVKNVDITIPNSLVLNSHIINFSTLAKTDGLILNLEVTIGYDAPWRQVHDLLVNAALKTENILASPSPFVYQTSLDDSYVRYELNAYTRNSNAMVAIYSELRQSIQDSFNAAGVEIMSPIYSAIRDGNTIAIPESDRPSDYQAPSFRVSQQQGTETGLGEGVRI